MPKITPQHNLSAMSLPTKSHQRTLPTHVCGTSGLGIDVRVGGGCIKIAWKSKSGCSSGGPANKPELRNFSAMKSGYTMRLFMHDINNDEVRTRIEDVEAWLLLVKHRNMRACRCLSPESL